mmetsp:Transcript_84075/g.126032  ORF Transcript_84075/g.126032 Transcript_84075/m.126032 type:complete len:1105 (+) Transcript_84075:100-3414(+)
MLRPPRSRKRFRGKPEGTDGKTNLSGIPSGEEADGQGKRRRMALGLAVCLLISALVIWLIARDGNGKEDKEMVGAAPSIDMYEIESTATLDVAKAKVQTMKHKKSGMQVMTMVPDDHMQDAVFGASFRTLTENTHGVPRVVEQALRAGSEKYPIKDPFNQMKRGSLQTYSDTYTSKDRTVFTLASRNRQDFNNGMDVMLDGIFHPLMVRDDHAWIFRQEGWRLELVNNERLYLSGNAMNSAKASQMYPNQSMLNYIYGQLFPDNSYSINPDGVFQDIVSMTQREVVEYYNRFYKPANGQAFCYGPQSFVNDCLDKLDGVLKDFEHDKAIRGNSKVLWQNLDVIQSGKDKIPYPSYQDANDFRLATSWVLNDQPMDSRTEVAWFLLDDLLMSSPDGTVARIISNLDLGDDVIGGLESSFQQWVFTVGVTGITKEDNVEVARTAIREKLNRIVADGFGEAQLKATFNKVDYMLRDVTSDDVPQGVKAFRSVLKKWNYDQDPKLALLYAKELDRLRDDIESNGQSVLLDLIQRHLIDNTHKTTVQLFPSTNLAMVYASQEQTWIDSLDDFVTKEQGLQLLRETNELHTIQEKEDTEEELSLIPRLDISDLNATMYELPIKVDEDIFDSGLTLLEHTIPNSNGVAYFDFVIDISNIDFDDIVLLPLFCQMLMRGGTAQKTDVQFQREVDTSTGGITVFPVIDEILQADESGGYIVPDGKHLVSKVAVRTSCLTKTGGLAMFTLIRQLVFDAKVDNQARAIEVLEKLIDDMEDDIQVNGHVYTTRRINSRYSLPGFFAEQWKGVTQLFNLRRALAQARADFSVIAQRMVLMHDAMVRGNRNGMFLSVTGDHQAIKDISAGIELFVKDLLPPAAQVSRFPDFGKVEHPWVTKALHRMEEELKVTSANEAFIVPTRINHVGRGGILYDQGERIKGADAVGLHFLSGYYLYDKVRFSLGASQAWAVMDPDSGSVIYQSENDPNIVPTLDAYDGGVTWLFKQVDGRDTLSAEGRGAVVGLVGAMDGTAYQPSQVGFVSLLQYLRQDKPEYRQKWRDEIIGTSPQDIKEMAERLGAWAQESIVVVTDEVHLKVALESGLNFTSCSYTGQACDSA